MEVEEDEMTKQLTVSEILLDAINEGWFLRSKTDYPKGFTGADVRKIQAKAKQSLKALVTEMVNEIIGEDGSIEEAHIRAGKLMRSPDGGSKMALDPHAISRTSDENFLRTQQRQRAKAEIERRFL
jgi:hypothetical protein